MSVQQENLKEIADAIREKTGTTELFPANTFAEKIRNIVGGGGSGVGQFYYVDGLKKGEIFNDYVNNIAMSDYSSAKGYKTIAGGKGYKIIETIDNGDGTGFYTLSTVEGLKTKEEIETEAANAGIINENEINALRYIYNIRAEDVYYNAGEIVQIDKENNRIKVNNYKNIPLKTSELENLFVPNYLTITGHPELGDTFVGFFASSEGKNCIAQDIATHAEGINTNAVGQYAHVEGVGTYAGYAAHAEGFGSTAWGIRSHSEGSENEANGSSSHAEGSVTKANGPASHSEGTKTEANGAYSHTEGELTKSDGDASHAEGYLTHAKGKYSHTEGQQTFTESTGGHAEGGLTKAIGGFAHAEGYESQAKGIYSHVEGLHTETTNQAAHSEGWDSKANGQASHAEGRDTKCDGDYSHAEGYLCQAIGACCHSEGRGSKSNNFSHAEGDYSQAIGYYSHSEGQYTIAASNVQHVQGKYNVADYLNKYAHITGNGKSTTERSNAYTLDWDGNGWYAGTVETSAIILRSSTSNSTKKFKLTIDDNGTLSATEI
jgi:hypothetical protein